MSELSRIIKEKERRALLMSPPAGLVELVKRNMAELAMTRTTTIDNLINVAIAQAYNHGYRAGEAHAQSVQMFDVEQCDPANGNDRDM